MKKSIVGVTVSLIALLATAGVAKADYPPIEDVKPSTLISAISYDRTPRSVDYAARRIFSTVQGGASATVVSYLGESITPVITGVGAGEKFSVRIFTDSNRTITLPDISSIRNGNLRLPTMAFNREGMYTVKIIAVNGSVRTLKIRVS
jgi:hypothetical protein